MQDNENTIKKTVIFTGGSDGLGRCALNYLVKEKGLKIILPVRNIEKGEKVVQELKQINENADLKVMKLDLSSFDSIKEFANEFNSLGIELDTLVNNAGILSAEYKEIDGYGSSIGKLESTLAVNHLGTTLLTNLLLPKLKASKQPDGADILIVASKMHEKVRNLDWDSEFIIKDKSKFDTNYEYSKSKTYNVLFAKELQDKLIEKGSKIRVNSTHPGWCQTQISRDQSYFQNNFVLPVLIFFFGNKLEDMGAALAENTLNKANHKGKYLTLTKVTESSPFTKNPENSKILWNKTCQLLNINSDFGI